jgi:predicted PurR-regulated permease PerM
LAVSVVLPAALAAYFLWSVAQGILVIFAAILFAVFLDGVERGIRRVLPIGRWLALPAAILVIVGCGFGGSWLGGSRVAQQAPQLSTQISHSISHIHRQLVAAKIMPKPARKQGSDQSSSSEKVLSYGEKMIGSVTGVLAASVSSVADILIVIILGIYFAVTPRYYLEIMAMLIPPRKRAHLLEVLELIGHALRLWFLGQFMAMLLVGVLVTIGLSAMGVKLSFILGVIAGLLTFVPYLGAIIAVIPALLVGLSGGLLMMLYVALLYLGVHIIEGYVFTPLVQRRIVHLAPALLLIAQLLVGLFAGVFAIFVAAPFAIVATIAVQKFYIEGFLAEETHVLGDNTEDGPHADDDVSEEYDKTA